MATVGWADSGVSGGQSQGPRRALAWQALTVPGEHSRETPSAWRLGSPLSPGKNDQRTQEASKCSCRIGGFPATFWAGLS